ncbi:MAG: DNA repair protein RecO C-terminal domain-containing protein [Bacteroidales bacterium]|nr:DNA repair protein RecO C-terminal domain-containing protein [Bacteroidales bacterium]
MLATTRGLFLRQIPYSDTASIGTIYTEQFGIQSFMLHRSRMKVKRNNLFQPLFPLDITVWRHPGRPIHQIRDARMTVALTTMPFDVIRSAQAMLIAEVLLKLLKEEEPNPALFTYLLEAVCWLDGAHTGVANFTVVLLFNLTRFFGVSPTPPDAARFRYFDLESGVFRQQPPTFHLFMDEHTTSAFRILFSTEPVAIDSLPFNNRQRTALLDGLLRYMSIHLDLSGDLKSLPILKEILA